MDRGQEQAEDGGADGDGPLRVARVVTELSLDREFDYCIPLGLSGRVRVGTCVRVPFGKGNRTRRGYVVGLKRRSAFGRLDVLKEIAGIEGQREMIPATLMQLARWISDYYCCTHEQAVRAMLPAVVRGGKVKRKLEKRVCLTEQAQRADAPLDSLTRKQSAMLEALRRLGPCPRSVLMEESGAGTSVLKRLQDGGWVTLEEREVDRDPFADDIILPTQALTLTPEQTAALETTVRAMDEGAGAVVLLHGVTGSGKTEVYLQAIQHCLNRGQDAIVLVPEISLTPQTVERFRGRFGDGVSVLHSGLTDGERFDEWTRVHEGRARIVVGARSALFAPFRSLGLIVVDEEHETTYKQDEAPRYNARDVAVVRGRMEGAAVVLGSATPSLESYYNCRSGKYRLAVLPRRVDGRRMPRMEVVDMRAEAALTGRAQIFSRRLQEGIRHRLEAGEQTILFLNRRGYATQLLCTACGYVATCEDCNTAFTYHRREGTLVCHLCGHMEPAPDRCPVCGDASVRYTGLGTEKVESAAHNLFPKATIARMDSDTMTTGKSYRRTLEAFRAGRIHILIGTQMIAKGLHFPNVTLVGVIFADLGLYVPDFRASERTFQLLTQVSGRAGRGDVSGTVIVQTYTPFHPALEHAVRHDYVAFFEEEMPTRAALGFPPATHLILVHFRSRTEATAAAAAETFAEALKPALGPGVEMTGPMPSPKAKIRGYFRYRLTLRGGQTLSLIRHVRTMVLRQPVSADVDVYADVDPRSLM